jgi:protein ImuA
MTTPSEVLQQLAQRIREMESERCPISRGTVSFGMPALENLLPPRGLAPGSLVELLSGEGTGAVTLALLMARQACHESKVLVIGDLKRTFYPPGAKRLGLDLERLIVVRPQTRQDLYAALDQSLRCPAVGAVVSWCDELPGRTGRRLQLAAETGGGLGFFIRPMRDRSAPSFASLRLLIMPVPSPDRSRRLQVDVLRCQGGKTGASTILEIHDAAGHVCLSAAVASATAMARADRASG